MDLALWKANGPKPKPTWLAWFPVLKTASLAPLIRAQEVVRRPLFSSPLANWGRELGNSNTEQ